MYNKNNNDPKTDPFGIPHRQRSFLETWGPANLSSLVSIV